MMRFAATTALGALLLGGLTHCAAHGEDLDPATLGKQTYSEDFDRPATPAQFGRAYPGLATWGYFAMEPLMHTRGLKLPLASRFKSRTFGFTYNVDVDDDYCPGAKTPSVENGALVITVYRFAPEDVPTCGQGKRQWASAMVTSQPSFAQAFGYFEMRGTISCDAGRWPAFWLLPVSKTPENGGRLAEVDVFEHYGGRKITVTPQGKQEGVYRRGQPISTLHYGTEQAEKAVNNSRTAVKPASEAERDAFCAAPHSYGVLWTPTEFRFYIDRHETFRTPNPGVTDPHYWVVNMDVGYAAGDFDTVPTDSHFRIDYVKVWALK